VAEGVQARAGLSAGDDKPDSASGEPLAEWEQELLAQASATTESENEAPAEA
jgi:small subunit ribosomal protein S2